MPNLHLSPVAILINSSATPDKMSTATTITHELIHEWFTETAARYPQAVAIECGERRLSYGEVEERTNTLANYLLNHGAGAGTIVAVPSES